MAGTYLDWSIGGLVPTWIVDVKWGFGGASSSSGTSAGRADSTVTLHCCAVTRDEIEAFKALMTPVFTNTNRLNGGTDLQVTPDGQILTIVNGPYTWNGIISSVQFDEDEYATIDGEAAIEFDIILELQRGTTTPTASSCPPAQVTDNAVLITQGFKNAVTYQGESVNLGTTASGATILDNFGLGSFLFNWDGTGEIYISSCADPDISTDVIWADDELVISTSQGNVTGESVNNGLGGPYPGAWYYHDLNITSILQAGNNCISLVVNDTGGGMIGCSPLYLVQIGGSGEGISTGTTGSGSGSGSGSNLVNQQITAGFGSDTTVQGNNWNVGSFTFNWNGQGKIYLASYADANPETDYIQFFTSAVISSSIGSITTGINVISALDVTSICQTGNNTINIVINNPGDGAIGSGALWIIQVDS